MGWRLRYLMAEVFDALLLILSGECRGEKEGAQDDEQHHHFEQNQPPELSSPSHGSKTIYIEIQNRRQLPFHGANIDCSYKYTEKHKISSVYPKSVSENGPKNQKNPEICVSSLDLCTLLLCSSVRRNR